MTTIGGATSNTSTDSAFEHSRSHSFASHDLEGNAAIALSKQKDARLSSSSNVLVFDADSCRGMLSFLLSLSDSLKGATRRSVMVA